MRATVKRSARHEHVGADLSGRRVRPEGEGGLAGHAAPGSVSAGACESACKKDPVFGVIGVQ
jgi:hypothetical protein